MMLRTITSVLEQDWPRERMVIVVSDDGHDPELARAVARWPVLYHSPPPRSAPGRDGAAKAGNLNSALGCSSQQHPELRYIETRDCDDELGSNHFLRQAVGQLEHDQRLAYVQTIKETQVSAGDPFNNREAMFYRGQMLSRNAANATFPCGSGLVWRRLALEDIGLFPTWNLVEDLQSGVEALRRGWHSCYLPIVGAMGQHSPEDVPNVYKQRGTWAIDTVRLMIWGDLSGLNLRQRAQFYELLCYYLHAFTVLVYVPSIVGALLGYLPFTASGTELSRAHAADRARHRGVAAGDQPPLQRPPPPPAPPGPRAVARAHHLERDGAGVHQGLDPGDSRRPRPQARLQGHAQARRPALALGPHAAADDGAADGAVHARLRAAQRHRCRGLEMLIPFVYWGGLYVALFAGFIARSWYGVRQPAPDARACGKEGRRRRRGGRRPGAGRIAARFFRKLRGRLREALAIGRRAPRFSTDAVPSRQERGH